ncbi:hypothetical protein M569_15721 [Genlisea aurea]|uniref:Uncharacterized protein n=1 Tax=Genlisea aurea TaxID=192259 RepID=S8BXH5_9LAMI|nr:hypothetical protein M569_15721 [Genlisea aurea]
MVPNYGARVAILALGCQTSKSLQSTKPWTLLHISGQPKMKKADKPYATGAG